MIKMGEFKLFSNCVLVRGAKRSTICDLQRNDVYFVPNYFADKLIESTTIKDSDDENLNKCISYLIENELGHFVTETQNFPDLDLGYEFPGLLSHAIVEISNESNFDFATTFESLSTAGVKYIELRILKLIDIDELNSLLGYLQSLRIINVTLFVKYTSHWASKEKIEEMYLRNQRISSITLYSSYKDTVESILGRIFINTISNLNVKSCGKINQNVFSCNVKTFSESQNNNTCLNGKISISSNGLIKNCPSLSQTFGTISDYYYTLDEIVKSPAFKKLWMISKDKIKVCRDCEFRHVCTDCRAYLDDPYDVFSKPLKCGYDPYTNQWEEWSTNPLKQQAIKFYGLESTS